MWIVGNGVRVGVTDGVTAPTVLVHVRVGVRVWVFVSEGTRVWVLVRVFDGI
jgi:hypothetical protein